MKYNCVQQMTEFETRDWYFYVWIFFFNNDMDENANPIF